MNKFLLFLSIFFFAIGFAQEKTNFSTAEDLLKDISPDNRSASWVLIVSNSGVHTEVKIFGKKMDYNVQPAGFQLENNEDQFYYYVYSTGDNVNYITDAAQLQTLYGAINNPSEAALFLLSKGYFLDKEFKELGANYIETKNDYILELSKISSEKCPYAKRHYQITLNKNSGLYVTKDNGIYFEVFDKSCKNNPRYDELQQQMDTAKLKKEEEALKNKEEKAKMKKKLRKSMKNY